MYYSPLYTRPLRVNEVAARKFLKEFNGSEDSIRAANPPLYIQCLGGLLTDQEYDIVVLRYGLAYEQMPTTLENIGKAVGISRERVRQILARSMAKLKHPYLDF